MWVSQKHTGPLILKEIQMYILTRAELLFTLCYEIPCIESVQVIRNDIEKINSHCITTYICILSTFTQKINQIVFTKVKSVHIFYLYNSICAWHDCTSEINSKTFSYFFLFPFFLKICPKMHAK